MDMGLKWMSMPTAMCISRRTAIRIAKTTMRPRVTLLLIPAEYHVVPNPTGTGPPRIFRPSIKSPFASRRCRITSRRITATNRDEPYFLLSSLFHRPQGTSAKWCNDERRRRADCPDPTRSYRWSALRKRQLDGRRPHSRRRIDRSGLRYRFVTPISRMRVASASTSTSGGNYQDDRQHRMTLAKTRRI